MELFSPRNANRSLLFSQTQNILDQDILLNRIRETTTKPRRPALGKIIWKEESNVEGKKPQRTKDLRSKYYLSPVNWNACWQCRRSTWTRQIWRSRRSMESIKWEWDYMRFNSLKIESINSPGVSLFSTQCLVTALGRPCLSELIELVRIHPREKLDDIHVLNQRTRLTSLSWVGTNTLRVWANIFSSKGRKLFDEWCLFIKLSTLSLRHAFFVSGPFSVPLRIWKGWRRVSVHLRII